MCVCGANQRRKIEEREKIKSVRKDRGTERQSTKPEREREREKEKGKDRGKERERRKQKDREREGGKKEEKAKEKSSVCVCICGRAKMSAGEPIGSAMGGGENVEAGKAQKGKAACAYTQAGTRRSSAVIVSMLGGGE